MFTVYIHKFPNNKIYVGITSGEVKKRWRCGRGYSTQQLMWRAIQKYGWDNIQHIIVGTNLSKKEACNLEIKLIAKYKSDNPKYGYNVYKGGDTGRLGIPLTESEKQRLLKVNKDRPKTPQEIIKIKHTLSKYWTEDKRKEFGELYGGSGFCLSEDIAIQIYERLCNGETRRLLANEYSVSKSVIDRIANKQYWSLRKSNDRRLNRNLPVKYVYQYDLKGNFIRSWNTIAEIHKELNFNNGLLSNCCNHKLNTAYGYIWRYVLILDIGKEVVL